MQLFQQAKWIWLADRDGRRPLSFPDQYVEFTDQIDYRGNPITLYLSCDSDYILFVNGSYVASNQYGDHPHYKIYDTVDLTPHLAPGANQLRILVHHWGIETSRYVPAPAGLIYEVYAGDTLIACSSQGVQSAQSTAYRNGQPVTVSGQLGLTFSYNAARVGEEVFAPSQEVEKICTFYPRPIPKHRVLDRHPFKAVTALSPTHYLVDLGEEAVGLPTLELFSQTEQTLTVAWGEHIADGGVRMKLGGRNFYYEYKTHCGLNRFTDYMLRLGCRYLELFAEAPITLHYAGILPTVYEVEEIPFSIDHPLHARIYQICINTLRLCMMEHYVDCPWREQALYAYDSRNQMLCGYYAFAGGNAPYARANLRLIGMDRRADGMLSICHPAGMDLVIPSYSLYYFLQMKEYADYTGDLSLAEEMLPKLCSVADVFLKNMENGLLNSFSGANYWNFYDWSPYLEGTLGISQAAEPDLCLNCLFVLALDCLESLTQRLQHPFPYAGIADALREQIRNAFFTDTGVFTLHRGKDEYTFLGNSLAILAKAAHGEAARIICRRLTDGSMSECSLAMKILQYDALCAVDAAAFGDFIFSDIEKNYRPMVESGGTTVWETVVGEADFGGAGSLCHGWSAIPIVFYHRLGNALPGAPDPPVSN